LLKVYLKQLAFALSEAAASDDPKVIGLALDLLEVAAMRFRRLRPRSAAGYRCERPPRE
jgi:hypothetical protein